jgi:BRCA1-associated RING domain protein 1
MLPRLTIIPVSEYRGKGEVMLHIAARHGRRDAVLRELKNGAAVDVQNRDLQTPLHVACRHGHLKVAQLLIEHGAPLEVENSHGETPLQIAKSRGHVDIVRLLVLEGTLTGRTRRGTPGGGVNRMGAL